MLYGGDPDENADGNSPLRGRTRLSEQQTNEKAISPSVNRKESGMGGLILFFQKWRENMREWPSLIGQKFGMLTVIAQAQSTAKGQRRWICKCECGTEKIVMGSNLKRGTTVSCGCKHRNDLTGQKIGKLVVLERSDQYSSRGKRKPQLWKCQCDCGTITYKATDTLMNPDVSMCRECAGKYAAQKARENAGFEGGTQISKIKDRTDSSDNLSGYRGVYLDCKTGKYRARLKFRGKLYNLGSFTNLEDAIKARKRGEEEIYDAFLADYDRASETHEKA